MSYWTIDAVSLSNLEHSKASRNGRMIAVVISSADSNSLDDDIKNYGSVVSSLWNCDEMGRNEIR